MRVYGVTGWKNSGKTHLMRRLVAEFVARGLTVSTVKHAHHSAEIDRDGTDSFAHRVAGAGQVALVSPVRWAVMTELRGAHEPPLADVLAGLSPVDLVLIEGYKRESHSKIEAYRSASHRKLIALENPTIRAVAADSPVDAPVPVLDLENTAAIADFIAGEVGL